MLGLAEGTFRRKEQHYYGRDHQPGGYWPTRCMQHGGRIPGTLGIVGDASGSYTFFILKLEF